MNRAQQSYGRRFLLLTLAGTVVGLFFVLFLPSTSQDEHESAEYVGRQTCTQSDCHATDHGPIYFGKDEFVATAHANIHKRPSTNRPLIGKLFGSDTVLHYRERGVGGESSDTLLIHLRKTGNQMESRLSTGGSSIDSSEWMQIEYSFGGTRWLQRYIVEMDGSWYVLPFQYVLPHYRDTIGAGDVVYLDIDEWAITSATSGEIALRRRDDSAFMAESWDNNCAGCHVNPFRLSRVENPDEPVSWQAEWFGSDGSDSTVRDINLSITCESCHGPGSLHANDPGNPEYIADIAPGRWDPVGTTDFWTDRKIELCTQCHSRHRSTEGVHLFPYDDDAMEPYRPKNELADFIRDATSDASFWPDGTSSRQHHQSGQDYVRSVHYDLGLFTNGCYDCHDVHADSDQPFLLNRDWYALEEGVGCAATGCHSGFAKSFRRNGKEVNYHSRHFQEHSQCVNCHYTKVASFGKNGHYEFTDHSDKVLRPLATITLQHEGDAGMPNTCALSCHRNGYGDRNRPDPFHDVIPGVAMRAPDFGIVDSNLYDWSEPSDIELADSLWEGFKRLYPQFVSGVRESGTIDVDANRLTVFPMPVLDKATVEFTAQARGHVSVAVYDLNGSLVRVLVDHTLSRGTHSVTWDRSNEARRIVQSGVYVVVVQSPLESFSRRVIIR